MLSEVFPFLISVISKCVGWLFTLKINESPEFTLGEFLIACAFIGIVIYFIFGSDFFPGHINIGSSKKINTDSNYQPRHAPGSSANDYSSRVSRHKY